MNKKKDFFEELENDDLKCVNCGRKIKSLKDGCDYCNGEDIITNNSNADKEDNTIASIIKVIAWIELVLGLIIGILGGKNSYGDIDFNIVITNWLLYGGLFIGVYSLGEIIQILHDIRKELRKQKRK